MRFLAKNNVRMTKVRVIADGDDFEEFVNLIDDSLSQIGFKRSEGKDGIIFTGTNECKNDSMKLVYNKSMGNISGFIKILNEMILTCNGYGEVCKRIFDIIKKFKMNISMDSSHAEIESDMSNIERRLSVGILCNILISAGEPLIVVKISKF